MILLNYIFTLDEECNLVVYDWAKFRKFIMVLDDINMTAFATKVYNNIVNSNNPIHLKLYCNIMDIKLHKNGE